LKYVVLGTTEFTLACVRGLLDSGNEVSALISMPKGMSPNLSVDIAGFAKQNKICFHEVADINTAESRKILRAYCPDYLFSSWPRILKQSTLEIPRYFCIGTHPTDLPRNRGRHPLHWLISLGISKTKLSFFRMDEGIDSGNLLLQIPFQLGSAAEVGDAVAQMNKTAYRGVKKLSHWLEKTPNRTGIMQTRLHANTWRKRTPYDVTLDLRMSASAISRSVRSFSPPFPCTKLIIEDRILLVEKVLFLPRRKSFGIKDEIGRMEPGRVLSIRGNRIKVKADDALIELCCRSLVPARLKNVRYIHPPTKYLSQHPHLLKQLDHA
jgi:methionyl-tRNA formyltransferase